MPVIVGDGTTGTEAKSDRLGIPTGTSAPSSPAVGDAYYNTSDNKYKVYDGSSWQDVGTPGEVDPYWNATCFFLECSSQGFKDDSSFAQTVSYQNLSAANFTTTNAKYGTSVNLDSTDGTARAIKLHYDPSLVWGQNDFTIDGWVYIRSNDTNVNMNARVFQHGDNQSNGCCLLYNANNLYFGRTDEVLLTDARSNWNDGWHHFAIVRWDNTLKLYRDGVFVDGHSGANVDWNHSNTGDFYWGLYPGSPSSARNNIMLDNIRITTAARWVANFNVAAGGDLHYGKNQDTDIGTTSDKPGTSAAHILSANPESTSGLYWIKGRGGGQTYPAQIWCDMERLGGGWMITHQHKVVDNEGVPESDFTGKYGTPSGAVGSGDSAWGGSTDSNGGNFTGDQIWTHVIGAGHPAALFVREHQYSGGSYKETHKYTSSTHGKPVYQRDNYRDLLQPCPANNTYQTGIRVHFDNGLKQGDNKSQRTWSSPSLMTINNNAIDQDLYFCNGSDGGDGNWCFGLMRGGTPYPRLADADNGGGRNSRSRWGIFGIRSHDFPVPNDPFNDGSGVAFYRFENNYNAIGSSIWNASAVGNATTGSGGKQGKGLSLPNRTSYLLTPKYGDGTSSNSGDSSISDLMTGSKEWGFSCWFKIDPSANWSSAGGKHSIFHGAWGDDHNRPGLWYNPAHGKLEYFSSSNGTAWDIDIGDTGTNGRGATTINQDQWYHIVYTRSNSGGMKGWLNGDVTDYQNASTTALYDGGCYQLAIGMWFNSNTFHGFQGKIDNVRFFNRFITQPQALRLYHSEL